MLFVYLKRKFCLIRSFVFIYKRENSSLFAWEIKQRLSEEMNCNPEDIPSVCNLTNYFQENVYTVDRISFQVTAIHRVLKKLNSETLSKTCSTSENSNCEYKHQINDANHENHQDLGGIIN
jgi:hypothetical protein